MLEGVSVSTASIIGMAVSMAIAMVLPVAAFIIWLRRAKAKGINALVGAVTFIVFALLLEQIFHMIVLGATGTLLKDNIWLYALYGGICAGVFEETGRLYSMKIFMKKSMDKKNAIMYGIGHGGIEAILLVGLSMLSNLMTAVMINNGQINTALESLDPDRQAEMIAQLSQLWELEPYLFYVGGVERISAFFLHIALSYIVYRSIRDNKTRYYFLAVFLHFFVDAAAVLLNGAIPVLALEVILLVFVAALWYFTGKVYRKEPEFNKIKDTPTSS